MKTIITQSDKGTKNLAQGVISNLKGSNVLALVGDLGAGKTTFTQGLAEYLGVKQYITSPTFVLINEYPLNNKQRTINNKQRNTNSQITNYKLQITRLIHMDCYRLSDPEELLDLGLEEYIENKNNLVVIEWADKIKSILPKKTVWIEFSYDKKGLSKRRIKIIDI